MDPVYKVAVEEGQILWADLNVMWKSLLMIHFDKCLCIFKMGPFKIKFKTVFFFSLIPAVVSLFLLYNKSFSSPCNVGHPKWGHSVCHYTQKGSKLGLKLSGTTRVHCVHQYVACFDNFDYTVVYLRTLSTSFYIIMDYTFYQALQCCLILLLIW